MRNVLIIDGPTNAWLHPRDEPRIIAAVEEFLEGHEDPVLIRATGEGSFTALGLARAVLDEVGETIVSLDNLSSILVMARHMVSFSGRVEALVFTSTEESLQEILLPYLRFNIPCTVIPLGT